MTPQEAKQDILNWLRDFVEKPNTLLNGWPPCPYAKEARLKNRVNVIVAQKDQILETLENEAQKVQSSLFDVSIIALVPDDFLSIAETKKLTLDFRKKWTSEDIYLLKDHPEDQEFSGALKMNHGKLQLFFLQKLSALEKASEDLLAAGYYDNWDPEYFERVVGARKAYSPVKA
jgi:hypothetical protein